MPDALHVGSGKVRELYALDSETLLLVATDRISTFDVVLPTEIPDKGRVLTGLSAFWFARTRHIVRNHFVALRDDGRSLECRRLEMLPVEIVVRGYLAGSGWAEYQKSGSICGIELPAGLSEGDKLPEPIFTPAFKAPLGQHDENITFEKMAEIVGDADAVELRAASLRIFATASAIAEQRGVLLADTKFEFGRDPGQAAVVLADEVLTSDSSRYWDADTYAAGGAGRLDSFDKQIVRDWLAANWDRTGEPPELPAEIVDRTAAQYRELVDRFLAEDARADTE